MAVLRRMAGKYPRSGGPSTLEHILSREARLQGCLHLKSSSIDIPPDCRRERAVASTCPIGMAGSAPRKCTTPCTGPRGLRCREWLA